MSSYSYDSGDGALSVYIVDCAFEQSLDGWLTSTKIDEAADAQGSPLNDALLSQLRLLAVYPLSVGVQGQPGCTLDADKDVDGLGWWIPIKQVCDEVVHLWADLADLVTQPAAKARLHDLLFIRKHGDVSTLSVINYL